MGEVLVKRLQNPKLGLDERFKKDIILYHRSKPNLLSEAALDFKHTDEAGEQYKNLGVEADMSGEESESEGLGGSGSSDEDENGEKYALTESDEDEDFDEQNGHVSEQQSELKDHLKEQAELYGGRLRRKVVFGEDPFDNNIEVANILNAHYFC